jgi:hypothetical protein
MILKKLAFFLFVKLQSHFVLINEKKANLNKWTITPWGVTAEH